MFQFYKVPYVYLEENPLTDVEGMRSFQVMFRRVEKQEPMEFGFANCTYVDLSVIDEKSFLFKLPDTLFYYQKMFKDCKSKILFIDKFKIDKPFRNMGIGSDVLKKFLLFVNTMEGIDKVVLCAYPYEMNSPKHIKKKPEKGDKKKDYYSKEYLDEKEKLESFYKKFGFESYKTPEADQQDIMMMDTYTLDGKNKKPINEILNQKKFEQMLFAYAMFNDDVRQVDFIERERCKEYFPNEVID